MAALIDFEREYMLFAASKLRGKSDIKDEELTQLLNETMKEWLSTKADYLGNKTPDEYFSEMAADELVELMSEYCKKKMNVPEPLYGSIEKRKECVPALKALLSDAQAACSARATALMLIRDIGTEDIAEICISSLAYESDISDIAADWLKSAGYAVVDALNSRYDSDQESLKAIYLDIMSCYPGVDSTAQKLIERLYNDTQRRAFYANIAGKFGDDRLLEPLMRLSQLSDMEYFDYIEIVNAIDALGGDPGDIREFYGDPDYEALRTVSDEDEE